MSDEFPYKNLTPKELAEVEEHFMVIMGGDAMSLDGTYTFTKSEAQKVYEETLYDLYEMAIEGLTAKDKDFALDLMSKLYIAPVRIH